MVHGTEMESPLPEVLVCCERWTWSGSTSAGSGRQALIMTRADRLCDGNCEVVVVGLRAKVRAELPDRDRDLRGWKLHAVLVGAAALYACDILRDSASRGPVRFSLFDDAMISMRYARNLAHGHGLVWNPGGPRVEGISNPLWTLIMSGWHLLPASGSSVALLVSSTSALLLLVQLLVVASLARRLAPGSQLTQWTAVLGVGGCYPLVFWSLRGMEVALLSLLVSTATLLGLRLAVASRALDVALLSTVLSLAVLTRMDGIVPGLVILTWLVWNGRRRPALVAGGLILLVLVGETWVRHWYYGSWLPNTYFLKLSGAPLATRLPVGASMFARLVAVHLLSLLLLAGVALLVARRDRARGLLAGIVCGQFGYAVWVGGDAWEWMGYSDRYVSIALPSLILLASLGLTSLATGSSSLRRKWGASVALAVAIDLVFMRARMTRFGYLASYSALQGTSWPFLAAVCASCLFIAWLLLRGQGSRAGTAWSAPVSATVAVVAFSLFSGVGWRDWAAGGSLLASSDLATARMGVLLEAATRPGASIAFVLAGAEPYYANRTSVDILGKNDLVVARLKTHRPLLIPWHPGHTKWDYAYSVGVLRPDLVLQLWQPTLSDVAAIRGWGYFELPNGIWIRRGTTLVDIAAIQRIVLPQA